MLKQLFIVIGLGCATMACQSQQAKPNATQTAAANPIKRASFYVRYLEVRRELQAEARFWSDSASFELPEGVQFNGTPLKAKRLPNIGLEYRSVQDRVAFALPYTFTYIEPDGKVAKIEMQMPTIQNLRIASKGGLLRDKGGVLAWDGQPLASEDALHIIITDAAGNSATINYAGATGATDLTLPTAEISTLAKGKARLSISYQHNVTEKTLTRQNIRTIEYYFDEIETTIQ